MINPKTNSKTDPSAKNVMADPPKAVGKITIKKGGAVDELVDDAIIFIIDFKGLGVPMFPTSVNIMNWVLTPLGIASGYPPQDDYPLTLSGDSLGQYKVLFSGNIPFRSGGGTVGGVMYQAQIQVANYIPTVLTDVDIEII